MRMASWAAVMPRKDRNLFVLNRRTDIDRPRLSGPVPKGAVPPGRGKPPAAPTQPFSH